MNHGKWDTARLADITSPFKQRNPAVAPDAPFVYIDVSAVSSSTLQVESPQYLVGSEAPSRARRVVNSGDTIFATVRPGLRRVAQVPPHLDDAICSTAFTVIRPDRSVADPDFVYFAVSAREFVDRVSRHQHGSGYPAVRGRDVLAGTIPLPPLPEQRAIAYVLRTVQRAKEATEQVIAAGREVKKSLVRHLLAYGPISPGTEVDRSDTPIGPIPPDWTIEPLGDVVKSGGGRLQTGPFGSLLHAEEYQRQGVPFVMPKDMDASGQIDLTGVARISEQAANRLARYRAEPGDVLVARRGEIGRRAIVPPEGLGWVCGSGSILVSTGSRLEPLFLSVLLAHPRIRSWLLSNSVGATMANLSTRILSALPTPVPPREVQVAVADSVGAVDTKIAAEEARRDALAALFDSLLHDLMTASLRVTDLKVSA